jgi:hypothetical protein
MSKFVKRLRKIKKFPENCILIGNEFGYLEDFCGLFANVFSLIVDDVLPKKRNLIHRQDFREISLIPNIDFVFVDYKHINQISEIENVISRFRCAVYINHGEFLVPKYGQFFGKLGYEITEINPSYQIWTPKK